MTYGPNFLVIGAEKSGTTWLYNKLKSHPEIFLPLTKECHFFNAYNSNLKINDNYEKLGWEWYTRFFQNAPDSAKVRGEITPMYLCDPLAPERIAKDLPNIKLIFILRHPVKRAYSHYWMAFRKGDTDKTFEQVVIDKDPRFIGRGKYAEQLSRYYDLFPAEQIRGYMYESFFNDEEEYLKDIHNFLGINNFDYSIAEKSKKIHASPKPKSKLFHWVIKKVATFMRKNRYTFGILDKIKETGFSDSVKNWNLASEPYPSISDQAYNELLEYYETDIKKIADNFPIHSNKWLGLK